MINPKEGLIMVKKKHGQNLDKEFSLFVKWYYVSAYPACGNS